jgi:3-oxoadipate enol-lactonase
VELTIPVTGGEIWARDTGGDGAPLVLLHPGWGDSSIWDPMIDQLDRPPGRYRIISYDARGYGRSSAPAAPYSQFNDLISVLDHLGVSRAGLVAHSGGGGPAMCFALAEPARVNALILVAPGIGDYPWPPDDPYGVEFGRLFQAGDRDGLVALGLWTWAAAGADPAARAQVTGAVEAFFRQGDYPRPDPPGYARLGEITAPSVLAIGDLDYAMVRDAAAHIAARIPGCRIVAVPGADHLLPLRAPGLLAGLVREYVTG